MGVVSRFDISKNEIHSAKYPSFRMKITRPIFRKLPAGQFRVPHSANYPHPPGSVSRYNHQFGYCTKHHQGNKFTLTEKHQHVNHHILYSSNTYCCSSFSNSVVHLTFTVHLNRKYVSREITKNRARGLKMYSSWYSSWFSY